ncbi:putative transmembrane family protein [Hirsutella rhossiliensis]|uniref:Transmembrane family protein n=1 Tax=Hirsutella rhossiliensis TaxID=111463 RepID=A0A9P8N3G0_9HYPO|nr:putative transmembrane family protein [Hirsutella rhossiliensis]KAH0967613.1 putative transmembrane family protein [Hirsutella rhossiliensis]
MAVAASAPDASPRPPLINYVVSFVLVSLAWGLTTPFIRRAARSHRPPAHALLDSPAVRDSPVRARLLAAFFAVVDLVRNPRYAVPLLINLTGSVWFFLLIGQAELSLTVPIVNTLAFLFTILGEWYVEGKVISKDTGLGMALSLAGIALCVHSKT